MNEWKKGMLEHQIERLSNNVIYLQTAKAKLLLLEEEHKQKLAHQNILLITTKAKLNWYGIND